VCSSDLDFCERTVLDQAENVKKLVRIHFTCLYKARETILLGSDSNISGLLRENCL
jgi:hypothetical protein